MTHPSQDVRRIVAIVVAGIGLLAPRNVATQEQQALRVDWLDVGALVPGENTLTVRVANVGNDTLNVGLSVQLRGDGGWGRTWYHRVPTGETETISVPYEVPDRSYRLFEVSLGAAPGMPSPEEPYPGFETLWSRRYLVPVPSWAAAPVPWTVDPAVRDRVRELRRLRSSRTSERDHLRELLGWDRGVAARFAPHVVGLDSIGPYELVTMRIEGEPGVPIEFSILGPPAPREPLRTVLYLVGNPPGRWTGGLIPSVALVEAGFLAVAMDRRPSARKTGSGEYLANIADPVFDARRLIDYLLTRPDVDPVGVAVVGFSRGASEAQFVAALHDSVMAAVLVAGVTDQEELFKSVAWLPTLYDPDILRAIGHEGLIESSYEKWAATLTERDHGAALGAYRSQHGFFDTLDPKRVLPGIAPTPVLIVTGASDEQFALSGVLKLDRVLAESYTAMGVRDASSLYIQPRTGHGYSPAGLDATVAFLTFWFGTQAQP
jgi:dienelactone hydrolase